MKTRTKKFAVVLAILLAMLLLCVGLFVATEQGHECVGENCEICEFISFAKKIIDGFATVGAVALATFSATYFILKKENIIVCPKHFTTLVTLNIKLSS